LLAAAADLISSRNLNFSSQGDRMGFWKYCPKWSQSVFCQNKNTTTYVHTYILRWGKVAPKFGQQVSIKLPKVAIAQQAKIRPIWSPCSQVRKRNVACHQ
jgi:hypothetical protein